jgi:hypothetical protein
MAPLPASTRNGGLGSEVPWQPTVRLLVFDRSKSGNQLGLEALLAPGMPVGRFAAGVEKSAQEEPPAPEKLRRFRRGKSP